MLCIKCLESATAARNPSSLDILFMNVVYLINHTTTTARNIINSEIHVWHVQTCTYQPCEYSLEQPLSGCHLVVLDWPAIETSQCHAKRPALPNPIEKKCLLFYAAMHSMALSFDNKCWSVELVSVFVAVCSRGMQPRMGIRMS